MSYGILQHPITYIICVAVVVVSANIRTGPKNADVVNEILDLFNHERQRVSQNSSRLYPVQNNSWRGPRNIGQVSGIAIDLAGNPVIFHRADRVWSYDTFDASHEYTEGFRGPIPYDTVLTLDPSSGMVKHSWGANMFYMPHGLHIDSAGNHWLTDLALHQVFKFQHGMKQPRLVLGERFVPGHDKNHFCQPTSVAVSITGEIVVADGYCNSRIMIFDPAGNLLNTIPQIGEFVALRVPHAVTILENGKICVADRDNMRVLCANPGINDNDEEIEPPLTIQEPDLGRVFAVASYGNTIYAVNGPTSPMIPIRGFIMNPSTETIDGHWGPATGSFMNPHGMAISRKGTELYVSEIWPNRVWKFDLVKMNAYS